MENLLLEYKESLKSAKKSEKKIIENIHTSETGKDKILILEHDLAITRSVIRDLQYAIDWMTTAREPGTYQGVEHRKAYEHKCFPLEFFDRIPEPVHEEERDADIKSEALDFLFNDLSELEKDIYVLIKAQKYSFRSAGTLLNISRSTISKRFKEAEEKIQTRARLIR